MIKILCVSFEHVFTFVIISSGANKVVHIFYNVLHLKAPKMESEKGLIIIDIRHDVQIKYNVKRRGKQLLTRV
jgi:hypothetical protein